MSKCTHIEKDCTIDVISRSIMKDGYGKWNYYELFEREDISEQLIKFCINNGQEFYFVPSDAWLTLTKNTNFPLKYLRKLVRMLEEDFYDIRKIIDWNAISQHKDLDRKYIKKHMYFPWKLEYLKKFLILKKADIENYVKRLMKLMKNIDMFLNQVMMNNT